MIWTVVFIRFLEEVGQTKWDRRDPTQKEDIIVSTGNEKYCRSYVFYQNKEPSRQDGVWPTEAFLKWKQEAIKCNVEHVSESIPAMPGRGNQGN